MNLRLRQDPQPRIKPKNQAGGVNKEDKSRHFLRFTKIGVWNSLLTTSYYLLHRRTGSQQVEPMPDSLS